MEKYGYHYRHHKGSLSQTHNKQNIISHWIAVKNQFVDCIDKIDETAKANLLQSTALAAIRAWAWKDSCPELRNESVFYSEISTFSKHTFHFSIRCQLSLQSHIGILFTRINHPLSFWLANRLLRISHILMQ